MSIRLPDFHSSDNDQPNEEESCLLAGAMSPELLGAGPSLSSTQHLKASPGLAGTPPFPVLQVFIVASFRASQTLAYFVIFPFVSPFLVELGISDVETVGYSSGVLEGICAASMVSMLFAFAKLGDRLGRKPVVITGVICTCVFGGSFGFGQTFAVLFVIRAMTGFFNAAQGALARAMMMEMSHSSNRAAIFAFGGMGWQIGATLAPVIGSTFAHPASALPSVFGGTLFDRYPYSLPCIVAMSLPLAIAIFSIKALKETLPAKNKKSLAAVLPPLLNRHSKFILGCNFAMYAQGASIFALEVLLFFTPVEHGGLGYTPHQMALYLFLRPLLITALETSCFPLLEKRFGMTRIFRTAILCYPMLWLCFFTSSILAIWHAHPVFTLPVLFIGLVSNVFGNLAFLSLDILTFMRAPTREQAAQMNATGEISGQAAQSLGAPVASSLFAYCTTHRLLGGRLVWLVMIAGSCYVAWLINQYDQLPSWVDEPLEEDDDVQV